MTSNHFPYTYSHDYGWLVLVALVVIGMWIRHFFNLKHQGFYKPQVLVSGIAAFFVLMLAIAPWHTLNVQASNGDATQEATVISDAQAWTIINTRCTECHSKTPTSEMFKTAPSGFVIDSIDEAKKFSQSIYTRAIISKDMPLANLTNMTDEERELLSSWLLSVNKEK